MVGHLASFLWHQVRFLFPFRSTGLKISFPLPYVDILYSKLWQEIFYLLSENFHNYNRIDSLQHWPLSSAHVRFSRHLNFQRISPFSTLIRVCSSKLINSLHFHCAVNIGINVVELFTIFCYNDNLWWLMLHWVHVLLSLHC